MWRALLIFLVLLPSRVKAASLDLIVSADQVYVAPAQGYHSIVIQQGATLTVPAGSRVTLLGGDISGGGGLHVAGTKEAPVFITGTNWGKMQLGGRVVLEHLFIAGAEGPFIFTGAGPVFESVVVQDVPDSRFFFHPLSLDNMYFKDIEIRWDTMPPDRGEAGFSFQGLVGEVWFDGLRLPRAAILEDRVLIDMRATYRIFGINDPLTLDGCRLEWHMSDYPLVQVVISSDCHPQEPSLLFVPGFGASLNFAQLTNPDPDMPAQEGWSFFPFLTNAYRSFLHEADLRSIKTATAFYDWRLRPADIVEQYLIPAIDALKKRDGVSKVYLVGHSYGGIVARYYIQSAEYRNDVAGLVQLATPNEGSAEAYAPWQAAVFPDEWQILSHLTRLYHYLRPEQVNSELKALRTFIPSGLALQPTKPFLRRSVLGSLESLFYWPNIYLAQLPALNPAQRPVPLLFTVAGTGEGTISEVQVGEQHPRATYWPDGERLAENMAEPGDGTVTVSSASLPWTSQLVVPATHMEVPAEAAELVLKQLYPLRERKDLPPLAGAGRDLRHILWFAFDCPVDITITTPSGLSVTSQPQVSEESAVYVTDTMLWMLVPKESGTYRVALHARETSEVRWWQGLDSVHVYAMKKDENRNVTYVVAGEQPPEKGNVAGPVISAEPDDQVPPEESTLSAPAFAWQAASVRWPQFSEREITKTPALYIRASVKRSEPKPGSSPRKLQLGFLLVSLTLLYQKGALRRLARRRPP